MIALKASNGHRLWSASTGSTIYSSPAVADGSIFIGVNDHTVRAFNASTGKPEWTTATGGIEWSSPTVANGTVYIGSRDDRKEYALSETNGHIIWTAVLGGWVQSSPAVFGSVVYVGSNDGRLYALDAGTGRQLWKAGTGGVVFSSPAVATESYSSGQVMGGCTSSTPQPVRLSGAIRLVLTLSLRQPSLMGRFTRPPMMVPANFSP